MSNYFDIIIIGGGPAGLTAAIYARRAGKTVLLLERASMGGQIATSPRVDNFPAAAGLSGAELSDRLYAQATELGAQIELEEAVDIQNGDIKTVITDYSSYTARAVILATGMNHRTLGLDGEDWLAGISYCAVCDGAFYEGKHAAVCGGGNSAVQEALFLSEICSRVTLIHRRSQFRADPILVDKLFSRHNITVLTDTVIDALESQDDTLHSLKLRHVITGEATTLAVDGLFEAVGHLPETALAVKLGVTEDGHFIPADESCSTNVSGIFVAGDCREKKVRQMLTACADGAIAALAACEYCNLSVM
jgi:thioredoxin reductase (NADPH)